MLFKIVQDRFQVPKTAKLQAFLIRDAWDDWGKFETQFQLVVFSNDGTRFDAGPVKIGEVGLAPGVRSQRQNGIRSSTLEPSFRRLLAKHFSLGQSETYYETLNELPDDLRENILKALRDCAFDTSILDKRIEEEVMSESLLRDISAENVRYRLHRLAMGNAILTPYKFEYEFSSTASSTPPTLTFEVTPYSKLPTNVHVLIGRNGVGKSRCLNHMARAILRDSDENDKPGIFRQIGTDLAQWRFAGLVFVSFSAFDQFDLPDSWSAKIRVTEIGLRNESAEGKDRTMKTTAQLAENFSSCLANCRRGLKKTRWKAAVSTLENDPLFKEANVIDLIDLSDDEWRDAAEERFRRLSSGHAIVLLTITRLVECIDEKSLVLFDEPEGHLHPPLLSAFVRSLSSLLTKRNGVAVVATHSPVVLQEVPRSCVWMLRRAGHESVAERPMIETFGENVGILTREVFGLEVTTTGFHHMITEAIIVDRLNYEDLLKQLGEQLAPKAELLPEE